MSTSIGSYGGGSVLDRESNPVHWPGVNARATVGMMGTLSLVLGSRLAMPSWAVDMVMSHLLR